VSVEWNRLSDRISGERAASLRGTALDFNGRTGFTSLPLYGVVFDSVFPIEILLLTHSTQISVSAAKSIALAKLSGDPFAGR